MSLGYKESISFGCFFARLHRFCFLLGSSRVTSQMTFCFDFVPWPTVRCPWAPCAVAHAPGQWRSSCSCAQSASGSHLSLCVLDSRLSAVADWSTVVRFFSLCLNNVRIAVLGQSRASSSPEISEQFWPSSLALLCFPGYQPQPQGLKLSSL